MVKLVSFKVSIKVHSFFLYLIKMVIISSVILVLGRPNLIPFFFAAAIPSFWRNLILFLSFYDTNDSICKTMSETNLPIRLFLSVLVSNRSISSSFHEVLLNCSGGI